MAEPNALIVTQTRNFWAYTTPYNTNNQLPADTVNWGAAWGTPTGPPAQPAAWVLQGYTDGGLHFATDVTRTDVIVDQSLDPVLRPVTARSATMSFNLAEIDAQKIQLGSGQGTINSVAPGVSTRGHDDLDIGSIITDVFLSIGFDIEMQDLLPLRFLGYKCQVTGSMALDFAYDSTAMVPVEATLLPDTSVVPARVAKIRDIIPPTS